MNQVAAPFSPKSRRAVLTTVLLVGLIALGLSSLAGAASIEVSYSPELGSRLVGDNKMTLYLFTNDTADKSNCYGVCATNWPPLLVDSLNDLEVPVSLVGTFGLTERTDGSKQVTYNNKPLYYWIADRQPGDATGHGVNNVWYVVNPSPSVQLRNDPVHGKILVDAQGMTLYAFANDTKDVSNCSGPCAINWPPLIAAYGEPAKADGIGGTLGLIARQDGAKQVTYNGIPLYGWIHDKIPGDTTGHGVAGNWVVVHP